MPNKTLILISFLIILFLILLAITIFLPREAEEEVKVTSQERNIPEAQAQSYKQEGVTEFGMLIVNSEPQGARVMLEPPDEEVASTDSLPVNITPFKVSKIPVGNHNLIAFNNGYVQTSNEFVIEANKITRLTIEFTPLLSEEGEDWIGKFPFQSDLYYVEYDKNKKILVATFSPTPGDENSKQEQIELLRKEVLYKISLRGVDLNKVKIEWIIQ